MSNYQQPDPRPWPPPQPESADKQRSPWTDTWQGYPPPAQTPQRTEPLAIASLICAVVVNVLGIVFGHIALARIRRSGDGGRGLAVAGLVIGYTSFVIAALAGTLVFVLIASGVTTNATQWTGTSPSRLPDQGPSPANMNANGGIVLGAGGSVVPAPASNIDTTTLPSPDPAAPTFGNPNAPGIQAAPKGQPAKVVVYIDFACPACANFHDTNGPALDLLRNQGKITLEYRPVNFLDDRSTTRYSSRASAAAACVANSHPDKFAAFVDQLYAHQPVEGPAGLSNQQLKSLASGAGADVATCIDGGTYLAWARYSGRLALDSGINGTPTAYVDGNRWGDGTSTGMSFLQFLQADLTSREVN
ncbi:MULTISPECIES: thioredoxin domain-containing protein [Arthrobacter]|nr:MULTISPECIES: thioredoxin domain-containing protein [Arthrobacter]MBT8161627.1 thioredoxin domain-containing protein [Arthrobacter sp. GN70]